MSSLRGRLLKFLLQNRHLLKLRLRKEVIDWSQYESILNFRQQVEEGANKFGKLPKEIKVSPLDIDGLYAEWILPPETRKDKVILYFHGGGLCLATLLALRDQGSPLPAGAVAYSPITDFRCTGESYQTKAKVCLSPEGMGLALAKHYAGDEDCSLPYISPLYGSLHGLPPLLIYAGEDETLRDDSIQFGAKAKAQGVDITLKIGEGMFHYPAMAPLFPEATQAMQEICDFIKLSF